MDTDHVSILQFPDSVGHAALVARMTRGDPDEFATSIISFHEQVLGANNSISRARDMTALVRGYRLLGSIIEGFSRTTVLPFDNNAVKVFDDLRSRGVRVATMDLRIASIAIARGLVVLTRNTRDFGRIPGVVTEDWTSTGRDET